MNKQQYTGTSVADTSNDLSNFWADCPIMEIEAGLRRGWFQKDDFTEFAPVPYVPTNTSVQTTEGGIAGKYKVYSAAAGTWTPVNAVPTTDVGGGIIRALCDTDGDQAALGFAGTPFLLNNTCGKMWGEARFAITGIATNNAQVFVGLGENNVMTFGAAQPLGNADVANTTGAMIGVNILEDGLGVLNACHQDRSATWVNPTSGTGIGTVAANTFHKVGWVYNPADSANAFTWYVNGVKKCVLTAATITAFTNLKVKGLGLLAAMYADSAGTANYFYLDWWKCYQLAP
jgi:hypothetical protein